MPDRLPSPPGPRADATRPATRPIVLGLLSLVSVVAYGVAGYVALGWPPADAFYMVFITISTVGYGEVRPIDSPGLRLHTMVMISLGILATGYTVAGVLQFLTENQLRRILGHHRLRKAIEGLSGHVIVVGMGRMGSLVCDELVHSGESFVVIDPSPEKVAEVESHGWLFVQGDGTEEDVLFRAGLARARALVSVIPNDAANVFITLTARQLAPEVKIVARAERASTIKKLRQAGASHVVQPAAIGAHRIVSILTNPAAVEFVELVTHRSTLAIEMDEVAVEPDGPLSGKTLRDADVGRRTGVVAVAVKRADGRVDFPPSGDEPFAAGDRIVLLGRRSNLDQFRREFRR